MRRIYPLLLIAAILAACTGPAQPNATPTSDSLAPLPGVATPTGGSDQITISYAAWDYERAIYEPLTKKFSDQNPGITVVIVPLDDLVSQADPNQPDSPTAALRRVVSGADTAPAFLVTPEALGSSLLLDLKPLMDADATFQRDDFYPGALDRWASNSGVWALPRSFAVQTLRYNRDLFVAAGVPEPKPGWTWQDLLAAAEQVQQSAGSGTFGFFDTSGGMLTMVSLLKTGGVDLLTQTIDTLDLSQPIFADSLTQMRTLTRKGVLLNISGDKAQDPQQVIREGRLALWGDFGLIGADGNQEPLSYATGQVPYPVGTPIDQLIGGGAEGYVISGGTAYPEASWKWIEFLTRQMVEQPGDQSWQTGRVPARKALANALNFWNGRDEQSVAALQWTIEKGASTSNQITDYVSFSAVSQALNTMLNDPTTDVKRALADAQKLIEESRNQQLNTTPTPKPDTSPVIVATPEPQTAPSSAIVVNFASWGFNGTDLRRLIRKFHEQQPEIYVQIKNTDSITNAIELTDLAQVSDCFAWPQLPQTDKEYAALLDLQPLIDADATFPRDDIPLALLSAYQRSGGLYGLPYAFGIRTLTYNRTLFDKAGITPPTTKPWTTDEFLQAAQALSNGSGEARTYGYVPLGGLQADLLLFTDVLGGQLTTGYGQETRSTFTTAETIKALQWYLDLAGIHKVTPPYIINYKRDDSSSDNSYDLVQNGKAAMWFDYGKGGFGTPGPIKDGSNAITPPDASIAPSIDVGIAPLPVGKNGLGRGDLYMRGYHISKKATNPQGCWEFLKFLSTEVGQTYGDIPARTSIARSDAYKAIASPERLEILDLYSEQLKLPMRSGDPASFYSLDTYWFFKALNAASGGKTDLAKEMDAAQKTTTVFMTCVAGGGKLPDCALKADPEYQGYNVDQPEDGSHPVG
ncbi:MAG: extracellular solute-binding protein [Roseiflexaceae bacterium]|nr:extracellular solute-binding protein [Roseiflexaceae bacterium]